MEIKYNIQRDKSEDIADTNRIDRYIFIGLILLMSILPILVRGKLVDFIGPVITNESVMMSGTKGEFYTYYKFWFILVITTTLLLLFFYRTYILNNPLIKSSIQLYTMAFMIVVAISSLLSPFKTISLFGMYNRNDGAFLYILACIILILAANINYSSKMLKIITAAFIPAVLINFWLGLSTFFGNNPFQSEVVQLFILPSSITMDMLGENPIFKNTLNNPNYISGFAGMTTVLFLSIFYYEKGKVYRTLCLFIALFSFITVLTSFSTNGFLTLLLCLPIILIVGFIFFKGKKIILPFLISLLLLSASYLFMLNENSRVWSETFGFLGISNPLSEKDSTSKMELDFPNLNLIKEVHAEEVSQRTIELPNFPKSGVSGGSGRVYIWTETMELALNRPLFGYGLGTIIYAFPQNDPEKQAGLGTMNVLVDKPHNIYLGIAYGTGILGLFTFALIILSYLLTVLKAAFIQKQNVNKIYFWTFNIAIIAFLIQGFFNDVNIGTYPFLWVLIGVVISLTNSKFKGKEKV